MNDSRPRATLKDSQLKSIEEIIIRSVSQDNFNKVVVEVLSRVAIDQVEMLQKFKIHMVKSGKTWVVEKTNPYLPIYNKVKNYGYDKEVFESDSFDVFFDSFGRSPK